MASVACISPWPRLGLQHISYGFPNDFLAYFTDLACEQRFARPQNSFRGLTDSMAQPCVRVHLHPSMGEAARVFLLV